MGGFNAFLTIANVGLNVWFLTYLTQLHRAQCTCADTWQRKATQVLIAASIMFTGLIAASAMIWGTVLPWLNVIGLVIALSQVVVTRMFVTKIRSTSCACAEHKAAFKSLEIYNIAQMTILAITAVLVLLMIAMMFVAFRNLARP